MKQCQKHIRTIYVASCWRRMKRDGDTAGIGGAVWCELGIQQEEPGPADAQRAERASGAVAARSGEPSQPVGAAAVADGLAPAARFDVGGAATTNRAAEPGTAQPVLDLVVATAVGIAL